MATQFDCIVAGISCVDLLIGPLDFNRPLSQKSTWILETAEPTVGGIVANCSMALARLGSRTAALSLAGKDPLGDLLISTLHCEGVDISRFKQSGELETSATAVLMNDRQEHIFAYKPGANEAIDRTLFDASLDFIGTAEYILVGYYGLLPLIEPVLDFHPMASKTRLEPLCWREPCDGG